MHQGHTWRRYTIANPARILSRPHSKPTIRAGAHRIGGVVRQSANPMMEDAMAPGLTRVKVAPKGMGLNDFVAIEEGFFAAEGLDVEMDWKTFRGTQSSWKAFKYLERPQDRPYTQSKEEVIQGACMWGTICNAGAGMGRVVPEAYGLSPWAIYVRPESKISKPEDLKDVPVSVGMRAGSHFNVPYRLEKYLPLENIKTVNTGGFGARLKALLDGEVEAASLLPPQIAMADQLGLRCIIADTFKTLWWVPETASPQTVRAYLNALDRAEKAMDANLEKYLPLWKHAIPAEFESYRDWDLSKFGRGERFVYRKLGREEFDNIVAMAARWGLDDFMKERRMEKLVYTGAPS
jgi:NitT/TauT family transport system substrate-binding protein